MDAGNLKEREKEWEWWLALKKMDGKMKADPCQKKQTDRQTFEWKCVGQFWDNYSFRFSFLSAKCFFFVQK